MKIYLYGHADGLSITELPDDCEGQFTILHTDEEGWRSRLLDAEGNGTAWTLYSTPYGILERNGMRCDLLEITDLLDAEVCIFESRIKLLCRVHGDGETEKVRFIRCPMNGHITIGKQNAAISSKHPCWSQTEAEIVFSGADVELWTANSQVGVYCNYAHVTNQKLMRGDSIDLFGLRLLYLGELLAIYDLGAGVSLSPALEIVKIRHTETERMVCNKHLLPDTEKKFDRLPRIFKPEAIETIRIENPPDSPIREEMPLIFSIGSSAFMSISSVMMATNTLTSAMATGTNLATVMPSVFMAGGMFVGSMLMPVFTRRYNEKKNLEQEKKRQEKYITYLKNADERIAAIAEHQKQKLTEVYQTPKELNDKLEQEPDELWSYMPFHQDFLDLRLGTAELGPSVRVDYPAELFTLKEDILRSAVDNLKQRKHMLKQVPLMLSLRETGVLGILGTTTERMNYLKGLLIQLCFHHSYKEMKLVFVYDKTEEADWEFARWFPHTWSDNGEFRAIGTDRNSMRNVSAYIESLCPISDHRENHPDVMCVVVLADSYLAEQCFSLTERLKHIEKTNMRVIAMANGANGLPKECKSVIVVQNGRGVLNRDIEKMTDPQLFDIDEIPVDKVRSFAMQLFNTHLNDSTSDGKLVDTLPFLDMLRCGNVEQINAKERWRNANPVKTLTAPVGFDKYGSMLCLDIHQNAHGPHGLIAGMTGSGKSEFIITYLLSMAINYSPLDIGFILIDYKGGGMSDTLAALPHTLGIIDNLGGSQGINRALLSIKSEILRRQRIFKEISEKKHTSNLDIYKYQAMYRKGELDEPLQHLILVSDEFAELKEQEAGFMDDIVSMARIGRSLGIHLILATQKPSGVVSPQIASNARFHVCMKVQDKSDSMEMLGRPEAALLTKTGRFYLQVGYNEVFELGQSAWSGAKLISRERYIEEPDYSYELLNDLGETVARATPRMNESTQQREKQVDAIIKYLRKTALELNMMPAKSWKPMLPEYIVLDDIDSEYKPEYTPFRIDPVIAMVDDPQHQEQYPLQLNLCEHGNVMVYGFTGSGKQNVVNAALYSLCKHHTSEELNIYSLDFSSESSRMFSAMPMLGEVIVTGEDEKIANFVRMMTDTISRRRKILSGFGGNIDLYRNEHPGEMPNILIVIQNYNAFSEAYDRLEEDMYKLIREGNRFGVYFLATSNSPNGIRNRLQQNFKQVLCLQMTDEMDYTNLIGRGDGIIPMERLGSGIFYDGGVLLFQTAFINPQDVQDTYKRVSTWATEIAKRSGQKKAPRVPILPEIVGIHDVCAPGQRVSLNAVPIGIEKDSMMPSAYDMWTNDFSFVLYNMLPYVRFFELMGEMLALDEERDVWLLDVNAPEQYSTVYNHIISIKEAGNVIDKLFDECLMRHNAVKSADEEGRPKPKYREIVLMINNISGLYERFNADEERTARLEAVLTNARNALNMYVIIQQENKKLSTLSMRNWYARVPKHDGIWLGSGITMQSNLRADVSKEVNIGEQFGYVVRRGKACLIKLLEGR